MLWSAYNWPFPMNKVNKYTTYKPAGLFLNYLLHTREMAVLYESQNYGLPTYHRSIVIICMYIVVGDRVYRVRMVCVWTV